MPTTHTVQQGEYLSLIAAQYGFHSYATIWDDPANADLKQKRQNPNVLLPGDELTIPDKTDRQESAAANAQHKYQVKGAPLSLRLTLKDASDKPVANAPCRLDIGTRSQQLTTDGAGQIQQPIPSDAQSGRLVVQSDALIDTAFELSIGELDPLDTVTGQIARLNNLGYDAGVVQEPADDDAKMQFRSAVEEFQCNNHPPLDVDGVCGPNTQATLKQVHGC